MREIEYCTLMPGASPESPDLAATHRRKAAARTARIATIGCTGGTPDWRLAAMASDLSLGLQRIPSGEAISRLVAGKFYGMPDLGCPMFLASPPARSARRLSALSSLHCCLEAGDVGSSPPACPLPLALVCLLWSGRCNCPGQPPFGSGQNLLAEAGEAASHGLG